MNIYDAAMNKLSTRSRTVWELEQYLKQKGFENEEIDRLIDEFKDFGYINDNNYCHEYFRYAFGKGKSKFRVFNELKQKGIAGDVISIAFDNYEEPVDEKVIARREAEKILSAEGGLKEAPISEKIIARIGRRLSSKGFSAGLIYEIIGDLRDEHNREN